MVRPEVPKEDGMHITPRVEFSPRVECRVHESIDTPRAGSSCNSSCRLYMSPRVESEVHELTNTPRADSMFPLELNSLLESSAEPTSRLILLVLSRHINPRADST